MGNPKYQIEVTQEGNELGTIQIELMPDVAPKHTENFAELADSGFYDGTAFHRVIPGFMIQGGDPNSKESDRSTWGFGDPNQKKVKAEFNDTPHKRGIISAARSQDPNSASSQFFICVDDAPFLDRQYSVFGRVTRGMDVADKVVNAPRNSNDMPDEKIEMKVTKIEE
jgi:peptidyl-prolyl cis-trans isomerase B (cyclophilin B)